MVIQLAPETEALLDELVQRGTYPDRESAIAEALRVLKERDQYALLKAAIDVGFEQYERGETVPWTPDYFDRVRQEAVDLARSGKPIKDEVKP